MIWLKIVDLPTLDGQQFAEQPVFDIAFIPFIVQFTYHQHDHAGCEKRP